MKKFFAALLMLFLLVSLLALSSCSADSKTENKKTILFLGDSIAEGVAGPMPFNERESYAYYGVVGKTNGYKFYNRAVSGSTTSNLLSYVKREDDGVEQMKSLLTAADIIHISIVGNDLILSSRNAMMLSIARGDLTELQKRRDRARANLDATLSYIRSLNPTATIFLQTLYNPAKDDSPLIASSYKNALAQCGYTPDRYHELMGIAVREINKIFTGYIADHSDSETAEPTYLCDVYSALETIRDEDPTRWERFFQEDGIHPKNEGHAAIAEVLQQKLDELSLSGKNVLKNYKAIRAAQLERIYPNLKTKDEILKDIRDAKTVRQVSNAYFDGVSSAIPKNENTLTLEGTHFDESKLFRFDTVSMMDLNLLSYFNANKSYIRFGSDGTFEMTAELSPSARRLVAAFLDSKPFDVSEEVDFEMLAPYVKQFFPGVDPYDLNAMIDAFETAHGIVIEGIDRESEAFRTMSKTFRETKHLVLSSSSLLKEKIRVRYVGQYRLETYPSPVTKEPMTAVYLNNAFNEGESYARMLLTESDDGKTVVHMAIEVLELDITATKR